MRRSLRGGQKSATNPRNSPFPKRRVGPRYGEWPCHFCDRVFTTDAARGSHERYTHL